MAETASDLGRLGAAQQMYEESRSLFQALDLKPELSAALIGEANLATRRGDLDAAKRLVEQALQLRIALNDPPGMFEARLALAQLDALRQDWTTVDAVLVQAQQLEPRLMPDVAARAELLRVALLLNRGQGAAARAVLGNVAKRTGEYNLATKVEVDLARARILATEGRTADASSLAEQIAARNRKSGLLSFELKAELTRLDLRPRNPAQAAALARRARAAGFMLIAKQAEAPRPN
jgi:hypothetical protein